MPQQNIGFLEHAHATIKTSLKTASREHRKQWHKFLPGAILNYNTTYHSSIDCEKNRVFHVRVLHNNLDQKLGLRLNANIAATTDFAEKLLRRTNLFLTKPRKMSCSCTSNTRSNTTKSKSFEFNKEILLLHTSAESRPPRVKKPFRDFRWIGSYLVEKFLPNNTYIVRKLNTNKTQLLHRTRLRNYNPEKPPQDNYQEAQWQIDDIIVIPKDELYTLAWEVEFGGHLFDIPIIYTDPNTTDFDRSYTRGPDTVIVPRSYFHDPSDSQNGETFPTSEPSVVHSSDPKSHGQCQDVETTTNLRHDVSSQRTSESSTYIETAYEPMQQPAPRRSDNPSRLEINDPTNESILQNEPSHSGDSKYNLHRNANPK